MRWRARLVWMVGVAGMSAGFAIASGASAADDLFGPKNSLSDFGESSGASRSVPVPAECVDAKKNVDWVIAGDSGARATYERLRREGASPIAAVIGAQGHNPSAQDSIRRCMGWAVSYLGGAGHRATGGAEGDAGRYTAIYWDPTTGIYGACLDTTAEGVGSCAAAKCQANASGHPCMEAKACSQGGWAAVASGYRKALGVTCGAATLDSAIKAAVARCEQQGTACVPVEVWQH
jgi:hypothetical protein